eukprot:scaffold90577_cov59-Phaeocystis_antarctica.AAC.3
MPLSCWPTSASWLIAASPKTVVGAEWSEQCESEGAAWHPQSGMARGSTTRFRQTSARRLGSLFFPIISCLVGALHDFVGALSWQASAGQDRDSSTSSHR